MSLSRSVSSSKEKVKATDFLASIGFQYSRIPKPRACPLNRFALELFFQNIRHAEKNPIFNAGHIEHAFKRIAEASNEPELTDLKLVLNHLFLHAFLDILADNKERAQQFVTRQGCNTTFTAEQLKEFMEVDPNNTDSIPTIFNNILGPVSFEFDPLLASRLDQFLKKNTIPPAVPFLLKKVFVDEYPDEPRSALVKSKFVNNREPELWAETAKPCQDVEEIPEPRTNPHRCPFAKYEMTGDSTPTLVISRPKYITPQLPTVHCIHAPKYTELVAVATNSPAFVYSYESCLMYSNATGWSKPLQSHRYAVSGLAISDDGEWVLSGDIMGNVKVQHVKTGKVTDYESTRALITSCAFSKEHANMFVVGTMNGPLSYYEASSISQQIRFYGHTAGIVQVLIHPNDEYIASASCDYTIRLWSISLGLCVRKFRHSAIPTSMRFAHHGHWIMTTTNDGTVNIIDAASGEPAYKPFKASDTDDVIMAADFSQNDQIVVGYDRMGNFFMWELSDVSGGQLAFARIDKLRIVSLDCISNGEFRVIGCEKQ